jgi:hypothetical protein
MLKPRTPLRCLQLAGGAQEGEGRGSLPRNPSYISSSVLVSSGQRLVFTSGLVFTLGCVVRKLVNMRLDEDLLRRVDAAAGRRGRTRFVERALEAALADPLSSFAPGEVVEVSSFPPSDAELRRIVADRRPCPKCAGGGSLRGVGACPRCGGSGRV